MDAGRYLERIAYAGGTHPNLETLSGLVKAHLLAVPFENLDIHRGLPIDLGNVFHKIVVNRRGGFCYELNYLFYQLLKALGYEARLASGRVYDKEKKTFGQEFDHLVVIVTLGKTEFIADVGFGEFAFSPIAILPGRIHDDERGRFRIEPCDTYCFKVQKKTRHGWDAEYIFSPTGRNITDFTTMCRYHQTHPDSHFTQKRLCSLATCNGRITLSGHDLKIRDGDTETITRLSGEPAFTQALADHFGISF